MRSLKYIYIIISLTLFIGCVKYSDSDLVSVNSNSNKINFSIDPSTKYNIGTKSGDEEKENYIHRGYLFVFSPDGKYKGSQKLESGDIVGNGATVLSIETTISGYDSSKDKIICVFNYCNDSFDVNADFSGITKETVSNYFPFSSTFIKDLEKDIEDKSYSVGMPMYVNDFDDTNNNSVHEIYRSLAKIELFVKQSNVSTDLIDHAHTFNTNNVEFALVNEAIDGNIGFTSKVNIEGKNGGEPVESIDVNNLTFYQPSEPRDGSSINPVQGKVLYLYEFPYATKVINGNTVLQGEYSSDRLSLILRHIDNVSNSGVVFFYKLQLVDKSTNNYYNIERNHDYRVVISSVYSDGYTSLQEAYDMPPSNIEYEVFDDKGDITLSNGQYAISMDEVVNYENVTIFGPYETTIKFSNIRSIFPKEAIEGLTQDEIDNMTNSVEYKLISKDNGLEVVDHNEFATNPRLTADGRSINLTISGEGKCVIKLVIKLGNLTIGNEAITINKIGGEVDLGGDSSFDAHPGQLIIADQELIPNTWNSEDSDFGARLNENGETVVYMGENATPVGYKTMDGYISSALSVNAYPYFAPKSREGYYSYYDKSDNNKIKKAKIVLNQLAPFYVGHFGGLASGGTHYYDALIVEKIEEIEDNRDPNKYSPIGGTMEWSETGSKVYYRETPIYGEYGNSGVKRYLNFVEGLSITKYIVEHNREKGSLPSAAHYCYMKNDINGDGEIGSDEPIVWFLPAKNQMLSMWISRHLFESDPNSSIFGFTLDDEQNPYYWTSSEVHNVYWGAPYDFTNNVTRVNMLEGEMNNSAMKGISAGSGDYNAHVRCVRGIVYHK